MATVRDLTEPSANYLLPVLAPGPNVCPICRTSVAGDFPRCYQCGQARQRLPVTADGVLPYALSVKGAQYAHELWSYKNSASLRAREELQLRLGALLWRWARDHEACFARRLGLLDDFDVVTVVPSTSGRTDAPLPDIVGRIAAPLAPRYAETMIYNTAAPAGRSADITKFRVTVRLNGESVLVVDDTWTQGGHAQSAAAALKIAGAGAVGIFVLGRHFTTQQQRPHGEAAKQYLDAARRVGWSFDNCAAE